MDRGSYKLGGIVIVLAGVLAIVGGAFHPAQPGTLQAFAALGTGWTVSHVAIGLTGALMAVSALFLSRDFGGAPGEGWALVGSGVLLLFGVALLLVGAFETTGFSGLLAAQEGGAGAAAEHAFLAGTHVMSAVATAGFLLAPAAIAAFGLAMAKSPTWPAWLGWSGAAIGAAVLVVGVFGIPLGAAAPLTFYLVNAWIAVVGVLFFGKAGRAAASPATEPGTTASPARERPAETPAPERPRTW